MIDTRKTHPIRFGVSLLFLLLFCAPLCANFNLPTRFGTNNPNKIDNPNIEAERKNNFDYKAYQSTIYDPFGNETPSSGGGGNPANNDGNGSGEDVGIPDWGDTPSEPLPIADGTLFLLLIAATMITIIAIKQRKQKQSTTMTPRKHTYHSLLPKLFLLLVFCTLVGQTTAQTLYKKEIFNRSEVKGNRPTNFPRKDVGSYKGSFQGAHVNGAFYTYDRWIPGLVKITDDGTVSTAKSYTNWTNDKTGYTTRAGVCCDTAGNLIINPYYGKLVVFSGGNLDSAKELTYSLGTTASCNYISASGDVMSSTGGYIYFFPNEQTTVYVIKIVNGDISSVTTVGTTKCKGYGSSYVIPLDNTSKNFIYHSRHAQSGNKYYHYNGSTHRELCTSNTIGGTAFTLGGVQMFIQTANDNYKGGWRMSTLSTPATYLLTQESIGTSGYSTNESTAAFFTYKRINDYNVELYEYSQGQGIAAWVIGYEVPKTIRVQTYSGSGTTWNDAVTGGTISNVTYTSGIDAMSTSVTTSDSKKISVNQGTTVKLTATAKSGYTFIGWWNQGVATTSATYNHPADGITDASITARFAQCYNQTPRVATYNPATGTYQQSTTGGTVTINYDDGTGVASKNSNKTATVSNSSSYRTIINSIVTLTATPATGYVFIGWYKGDEHLDWATTNECSFKADNAYNITARFTKLVTQTFKVQTYESTAYTDGGNGGTMTVSYNDGTTETVTNSTSISNLYQGYNVTLTASAKTGYKFMGWFNNDFTTEYSEGSNTYTYRGEGPCTIYARFRKTYNQTVNISTYNPATGQYVASSDGGVITTVTYDDGNAQSLSNVTNSTFTPLVNTTVTVTADSKSGYKFNGWYSGETLLSEDAEYTYTVNAEKTITARFASQNVALTVSVLNYDTKYNEFREYEYEYNKITLKQGESVLKESYSSFSYNFTDATSVTLTATPEDGEDGYDFIGWYQNNTLLSDQLTTSVNVIGLQAISAHFAPKKCWKLTLKGSVGGLYSVKYARETEFLNQDGMYYIAHSQYNRDVEIYVPYQAKIAIVNPQPIHGYEYIIDDNRKGCRIFNETNNHPCDIINNDPRVYQILAGDSYLYANLARTEEQVVYLDISNKDKSHWKDVNNDEFYCSPRSLFMTSISTQQFEKVDGLDNIYKVTIPELFEGITIVKNGDAANHTTLPLAIPSTRYNCFKLNASQSSTGEWVDAWTTLPAQEGDFRLAYIEQTVVDKHTIREDYRFDKAEAIKPRTSAGVDTLSLHIYNKVYKVSEDETIDGMNNPEILLQKRIKVNGAFEWQTIERRMVFGPLRATDEGVIRMPGRRNAATTTVVYDNGIDKIKNDDLDNGSGVWNFVISQDGNGNATILADATERYTGDYYIRTTNADGQYNNYTHPGNIMTYSAYAADNRTHTGYTDYFIRYVDIYEDGTPTAEAGKHPVIKFAIANDYAIYLNHELMLDNDRFEDDEYGVDKFVLDKGGAPNLPADASVRFGWDRVTNRLTRAYIANTTIKNNEYLVVEEGENIGDPSGDALYFTDNSNWLYSIDLPNAEAGATAKVKAKMNGEYQYFMGAQPGSQNEYQTLISGNGTNTYPIRLLYDFKDDRFTTIYHPESGTINNDVELSTPLMIEREHNNAPTQIQLETNKKITTVQAGEDQYTQPAYAVMTFLESVLADASKTHHEKMFYWISFPFDVQISDVFGLGKYGKYWIMQRYDGKQRATSGLAQNNWKYITNTGYTLEKNVGYVICLNYNQILQDQLFKSYGGSDETLNSGKLSLYFPSNSVISPAAITGGQERKVTLERYDNTNGYTTAWNHWNWHVIGVPSFADPTLTDVQTDAPFVYQYWHPGDAYDAKAYNEITFHAMHSYMVQYAGDITWESVVNTGGNVTPQGLAAKTSAEDKPVMLRLELQQAGNTIDRTYVQLRNDKGTLGFDLNLDLSKIINAGSNIYSVVSGDQMAGNAIPKEETVLPIGVVTSAAGEYTFAMPQGTEGMLVELIDYEQGTAMNLLMSDYTVTLPKGTFDQRFALRLKPDKVATSVDNIGDGTTSEDAVRKLLIDGMLYMQRGNITYDAQGRIVFER